MQQATPNSHCKCKATTSTDVISHSNYTFQTRTMTSSNMRGRRTPRRRPTSSAQTFISLRLLRESSRRKRSRSTCSPALSQQRTPPRSGLETSKEKGKTGGFNGRNSTALSPTYSKEISQRSIDIWNKMVSRSMISSQQKRGIRRFSNSYSNDPSSWNRLS